MTNSGVDGAQVQRTALAWQRTSASAGVVALFALREAIHEGPGPALPACALLLVLAATAHSNAHRARHHAQARAVLAAAALAVLAGALVIYSILL